MSAELLLPVLLLAVAAHIFLARWTRSRRRALGIAEGKIVSADDSVIRAPTLGHTRLGRAHGDVACDRHGRQCPAGTG
jgi:hypothetical protein